MGKVELGVAPDGTEGVVLDFDNPQEEDEWKLQARREREAQRRGLKAVQQEED